MTVIESIKNFVHRDHHQKHGHSASSSSKNQPKAPPQPNPESQQPQVVPKSIPASQAEPPVDDFKALDIKEPKSQPHNPESSMSQSKRDLNRKYAGELPEGIVLEEKMGDGAFSNVYKAWDDKLNIKVALKCVRKFELNQVQREKERVHKELAKKKPRATERANILKEVAIMRQLSHPAIIQLHSFSESTDHYFLKLELMEGGELFHQIVKLTYFSEDLSRWVVRQVAEGIKYLHNVGGVVHRDIKPENLLFSSIPIVPNPNPIHRPYDEDKMDEGIFIPGVGGGGIGRVKIADFGLSKIIWDEETGTPCGTVGYTAPEIVKDERYSTGVDMWALGCVLYTVLCGFPPFYDESINVLTEKVARGYYTFLSPWWDDISASSKDLITHLLDVNPERRYNIDQFLEHPWMRQPDPPAPDTSALKALPPALRQRVHHDSPLLAEQAGGFRSPGLASLKEAFDVTYAVHRMEEEGKRRRAGGRAGFGTQLNEVDEEEEDEDEIEATKRKYGAEVARGLQEKSRAIREGIAAAPKQSVAEQQRAAREYPGWGGADRKQAERELYDGRAGQRDRGTAGRRRGAAFELNINNATLLGKRKQGIGKSPLANQVPVNS